MLQIPKINMALLVANGLVQLPNPEQPAVRVRRGGPVSTHAYSREECRERGLCIVCCQPAKMNQWTMKPGIHCAKHAAEASARAVKYKHPRNGD